MEAPLPDHIPPNAVVCFPRPPASGTVAGPGGVAFADRITHVWTNTKSFLVVIHSEGPAGAPA